MLAFPIHVTNTADVVSMSGDLDDKIVHEIDVSMESCFANHLFTCCKDIISEPREVKFYVKGVNDTTSSSVMGTLTYFCVIAYTRKSGRKRLALCEAELRYRVDHEQFAYFIVHVRETHSDYYSLTTELPKPIHVNLPMKAIEHGSSRKIV